jgi:dihydroxyacid dehydratase/phosphogluconate dehydratase
MTRKVENAITMVSVLGGSTNAVMHLIQWHILLISKLH